MSNNFEFGIKKQLITKEELSKKVNVIVERKDVIYKLKANVTTL